MATSLRAPLFRFNLLHRRIIAVFIDFLIYICYAVLLYAIVSAMEPSSNGPIRGQVIAFFSLTLPVVLYGIVLEGGPQRATIGKRWMKIKVGGRGSVVLRNVLKFLPLEVAHGGVHWMYYFDQRALEIPMVLWVVIIVPQVIVLIYLLSTLRSKGREAIYDKLSNTRIEGRVESL